jgi:competence protein ComEA
MKKTTKLNRFLALGLLLGLVLNVAGTAWSAEKAGPAAPARVNINTAGVEQLTALPGVGARLAARIVEYRQKQGGFKSTQELLNVKGIGERSFQKIQSQLTVGETPARAGASR